MDQRWMVWHGPGSAGTAAPICSALRPRWTPLFYAVLLAFLLCSLNSSAGRGRSGSRGSAGRAWARLNSSARRAEAANLYRVIDGEPEPAVGAKGERSQDTALRTLGEGDAAVG